MEKEKTLLGVLAGVMGCTSMGKLLHRTQCPHLQNKETGVLTVHWKHLGIFNKRIPGLHLGMQRSPIQYGSEYLAFCGSLGPWCGRARAGPPFTGDGYCLPPLYFSLPMSASPDSKCSRLRQCQSPKAAGSCPSSLLGGSALS